ncbi:hypothetical protein PENTCL1PPCAC_19322, partial [Pristionchus entomophagus]
MKFLLLLAACMVATIIASPIGMVDPSIHNPAHLSSVEQEAVHHSAGHMKRDTEASAKSPLVEDSDRTKRDAEAPKPAHTKRD